MAGPMSPGVWTATLQTTSLRQTLPAELKSESKRRRIKQTQSTRGGAPVQTTITTRTRMCYNLSTVEMKSQTLTKTQINQSQRRKNTRSNYLLKSTNWGTNIPSQRLLSHFRWKKLLQLRIVSRQNNESLLSRSVKSRSALIEKSRIICRTWMSIRFL